MALPRTSNTKEKQGEYPVSSCNSAHMPGLSSPSRAGLRGRIYHVQQYPHWVPAVHGLWALFLAAQL